MLDARKNIMLGTAGHVDHGKTALVKLLTGCETDTLREEKERGLTIDLGFAPCRMADQRIVGIVDVPGHVDFIRNMVAGAHGVDVVILVVAADDGIMPQTREHLHILTLMGLRHGLVALTKIDLVDAARREGVAAELSALLADTFLAGAPVCPVSNVTGEGFDGFFDALNKIVDACAARPVSGLFRVWVEDVFAIRGSGTVVTGIPTHGVVRPGEDLHLLPPALPARVRRMQVYGQDATEARAGECVALNLPELDHATVRRGMLLCASDAVTPVTMAECELRILNAVPGRLEDLLETHLHVGTASVRAQVALLESEAIVPGQTQMVQLRLAEALPLVPGERFVLRANVSPSGRAASPRQAGLDRSGLMTIGGGRVLGVGNTRLRRRKQWTMDALRVRSEAIADPLRWCELLIKESKEPSSARELEKRCLARPEEIAAMTDRLRAEGRIALLPGGAFAHTHTVDFAATSILNALQTFHAANPQRAGMEKPELFAKVGAPAAVCELASAGLVRAGKLEQVGTVFARAGWSARLGDRDQALYDQVHAAFRNAGWTSPTAAELAATLRQPVDLVQKTIRLLSERGLLVRLDDQMYLHSEAFAAARDVALKLLSQRRAFSTMQFRDALGVSRKYAVPILDHLDRLRFTVRTGHDRTPGFEARKLLDAKPAV